MFGILLADHSHHTVPTNDLTMLTTFFNRCLYFHRKLFPIFSLLIPVRDTASFQIVRGQFDFYLVSGQDFYKVHPHLPGNMSQYLVPAFQLNAESGIRQRFLDYPINRYWLFFGQLNTSLAKLFLVNISGFPS